MLKFVIAFLIIVILGVSAPFVYREYTLHDSRDPSGDDSPFNQFLNPFTPKVKIGDIRNEIDFNISNPIIDIRTKEEYDAGHIKGAILIPQEEVYRVVEQKLPNKDKVYIYGNNQYSSSLITRLLRNMGYSSYSLEGGLKAWENAGLPLEKANSLYF